MQHKWLDVFLQEADDLLAQIEEAALALLQPGAPAELINQLFRAFHTIKGSGGMCGLEKVAGFTHHIETLLDKVRGGSVPVSPQLGELVLEARDHLKAIIGAEQGGEPVDSATGEKLIARLEAFSGAAVTNPPAQPTPCEQNKSAEAPAERAWNIDFRPSPDLFACGGNPALLFRDLRALGECEITAHTDDVPPLNEIQPSICYFRWTATLKSSCDSNAIQDVFLFVEDGSEIKIELVEAAGPQNPADSSLETSHQAPAAPEPRQSETPGDKAQAQPQKATSEGVRKALAKESTVRVPAGRLDRLVNLVGELVMNQSRLTQAALQSGAPELANPVQEIERLVAELRDGVLGIRMLPIGMIFGRFRRLAHDLAAELGKDVELVTEGADTELDKSILDQLPDPLVHLLRNCVDHGIEPPEDRIAAGKPGRGTIRLTAAHTGSDVVVSIEDDGRGINRAALRAKAVEKQLIAPDTNLSDKELLSLILLPGFSTAREVTNVSGRGVGMDAVKRQIDTLRGSISISSQEGKGTKVSLSLPLTLAIIDGLLVQVGSEQFIVHMASVTENIEIDRSERLSKNGRNVTSVRGDLISYIDLRQLFHIESEAPPIEKIVIVQHEEQRVGLVVDRVLGTHQTVLQSLGRFFRKIDVVSGATIMGDGRVALILDISAVVRFADCQAEKAAVGDPR